MGKRTIRAACLAMTVCLSGMPVFAKSKDNSPELRAAYIARVQQASVPQTTVRTDGSLWSPGSPLADVAVDFKASRLNDTVIIQVVEQTTALTTGNAQQNRAFSTSSAITGLAGGLNVGSVNPILNANSSQQLKGAGQVDAKSSLQTSLTGQVVSILPNGNLVVEAQRVTSINGQRDTMVVRGVVRPGDIGPNNLILSTQLMDLEVELKGKGLVSDSTRGPNPVMRLIMRLINF